MKAGISRICITPPVGVELTGYSMRVQPSTGVHDDLFVRSLYLENDDARHLIVCCDLLCIGYERTERFRRAMNEHLGLTADEITLACTHTHSGPATHTLRGCGVMDDAWSAFLDERLVDSALEAAAELEEVSVCLGEGECFVGLNRRNSLGMDFIDPAVPVIALKRPDDTFAAVLANYAVHGVCVKDQSRLISADLMGAAAQNIRERLPGEPLVMITNGAAGNVNPRDRSDDFSAAERMGTELAEAIVQTAYEAAECTEPQLKARRHVVEVPLDVLTAQQVNDWFDAQLTAFPDPPPHLHEAMKNWRNDTQAAIENGTAPTDIPVELQALQIGPARFGVVAAEAWGQLANELREQCGPQTYVIGYANGNIGYLPDRAAYRTGGYEIEYAFRLFMNFMVAPGGYEAVRDHLAALVNAIEPVGSEQPENS